MDKGAPLLLSRTATNPQLPKNAPDRFRGNADAFVQGAGKLHMGINAS
jgi:hypothetical protein